MDITIANGDISLTAAGGTLYLSAINEIVQRVRIAASIRKGSFIYNRKLGADYAAAAGGEMLKEQLDMLIREAAAGIADTEVKVTQAYEATRRATLRITHAGQTVTTEVDVHGNI